MLSIFQHDSSCWFSKELPMPTVLPFIPRPAKQPPRTCRRDIPADVQLALAQLVVAVQDNPADQPTEAMRRLLLTISNAINGVVDTRPAV